MFDSNIALPDLFEMRGAINISCLTARNHSQKRYSPEVLTIAASWGVQHSRLTNRRVRLIELVSERNSIRSIR